MNNVRGEARIAITDEKMDQIETLRFAARNRLASAKEINDMGIDMANGSTCASGEGTNSPLYGYRTGTMVVAEEPDIPFGEKLVYGDLKFHFPSEYRGLVNCALVIQPGNYCLSQGDVLEAQDIIVVSNYPRQNSTGTLDRYLIDEATGIPGTSELIDPSIPLRTQTDDSSRGPRDVNELLSTGRMYDVVFRTPVIFLHSPGNPGPFIGSVVYRIENWGCPVFEGAIDLGYPHGKKLNAAILVD